MSQALQKYTPDHPLFMQIRSKGVEEMINENLSPEISGLTFMRLAQDLGSLLMSNPDLAKRADPASVFNLILTASRHWATFGDGGFWAIPDGDRLRPQESHKFTVSQTKRKTGFEIIEPVMVFKADEPVTWARDDKGEIIGFKLNDEKPMAPRPLEDLLGAFGRARNADGLYVYRWFSREDIENYRAHSAAAQGGRKSAWSTDFKEQAKQSIKAAMGRMLCPVRTMVAGDVGSAMLPSGGAIDADFSPVDTAEAATDVLAKLAGPTPFDQAKRAVEGAETPDDLRLVWTSEAFKEWQAAMSTAERQQIQDLGKTRRTAIEGSPAPKPAAPDPAKVASKAEPGETTGDDVADRPKRPGLNQNAEALEKELENCASQGGDGLAWWGASLEKIEALPKAMKGYLEALYQFYFPQE